MHKVLFVASAAFALCLSACGKSPEERAAGAFLSAATGTSADVEDGGNKVTFGEGAEAVTFAGNGSATVPKDLPAGIYMPAKFAVDSAMESAAMTMVSLRTAGTVPDLSGKAQAHMAAGGWKQVMAAMDSEHPIFAYRSDTHHAVLAFEAADDGGVIYTVQVTPVAMQ